VASGTGTCAVTPLYEFEQWRLHVEDPDLELGRHRAVERTLSFTPPSPPTAATLLTPNGTISTSTPAYTWNAVNTSTYYYLWVSGPFWHCDPNVVHGCSSRRAGGTGTCTLTPSTNLPNGAYQWWIQTWNSAGYGPWSLAMSFTVTPRQACSIRHRRRCRPMCLH